jgi:hypothetical protein
VNEPTFDAYALKRDRRRERICRAENEQRSFAEHTREAHVDSVERVACQVNGNISKEGDIDRRRREPREKLIDGEVFERDGGADHRTKLILVCVDRVEVRLLQAGVCASKRPRPIHGSTGPSDRHFVDVIGKDANAVQRAGAERSMDRHGHRVGFFAARTTNRPDERALAGRRFEANTNMSAEGVEMFGMAKKEGLFDGDRSGEAPDQRCVALHEPSHALDVEATFAANTFELAFERRSSCTARAHAKNLAECLLDERD